MAKILFAIGSDSGDILKRWAWHNWIQLERKLERSNCQVDYIGLANDEIPSVDTTSFHSLCRIIEDTDLIVCNDNGLMHLADYLEKPTLVIIGPTSVIKNKPIYGCIIQGECCKGYADGCYYGAKVKCRERPLPCLAKIGVIDVYRKIQEIFSRAKFSIRIGQPPIQQYESFVINTDHCKTIFNQNSILSTDYC